MTNELLFRIIFSALWLILFVTLSWMRYASRQFSGSLPVDRRALHERRLHIIPLAFVAPVWFGGILLYAMFPDWIMFLSIPLPDWFRLIMVCVAIPGLLFALWGYQTLGRNWVHALEPSEFLKRKDDMLVTNGPYQYVRNPIYLGVFTFSISISLMAANWLLLLPNLIIMVVIYRQIGIEEEMLIARFGDEYRDYMKRTPRFLPYFRKFLLR